MSHFYTPWKYQKAFDCLTLSGSMAMGHWHEKGELRILVTKNILALDSDSPLICKEVNKDWVVRSSGRSYRLENKNLNSFE